MSKDETQSNNETINAVCQLIERIMLEGDDPFAPHVYLSSYPELAIYNLSESEIKEIWEKEVIK